MFSVHERSRTSFMQTFQELDLLAEKLDTQNKYGAAKQNLSILQVCLKDCEKR